MSPCCRCCDHLFIGRYSPFCYYDGKLTPLLLVKFCPRESIPVIPSIKKEEVSA